MDTVKISKDNSTFWDELCGTQLAKTLGVTDDSVASLKKFDEWYLQFYPYLKHYLDLRNMSDKKVLEIGLGYGTIAQILAASSADYTGLDIALGPVNMANHRIRQNQLKGKAVLGSILEPEFSENEFDSIIAIGCLHHTGDLQQAINNCHRLLKPGGKLIFMVYYAYSYRRILSTLRVTLHYAIRELWGYRGVVGASQPKHRFAYDGNAIGQAAPHTDWISRKSLRRLCKEFSSFECYTENIDQEQPFRGTTRENLLKTKWPRIMGLDLYAIAKK